jgi:type IV fimbrial biogenesis protein FimT
MNTPALPRAARRGLTAIECLIACAVTATAIGTVAPGFGRMIEKRHLEGAAAQLETDIHLARSLAVSMNAPLRLRVQQDSGGSCYVIYRGTADECSCGSSGAPVCATPDALLRSVPMAHAGGVQAQANVSSMLFSPTHGTVTPAGTLKITGREGRTLHLVVNMMGRTRACSPGGQVEGYPAC